MKFKVGDMIRIRNDLKAGQKYGFHIANQDMVNMGSNLDTIEEILAFPDHITYKLKGSYWAWTEEMLEPADSKTLYAADGTIIGDFNTGGTVSIHDLPTSEWYNPMRLTFKNGSSIEALPQKDDTVRGENHFCNGFRGGKIPTSGELIISHTEMERAMDRLLKTLENPGVKFGIKNFEQKLKEEKKMPTKFTFYVTEGTRVDKSCNGTIPTMTTTVVDASGKKATVTCDKVDYSERQGVLEAIAQIACGGNFDKEYDKAVKKNKLIELHDRTCTYCGKVFDTVEELKAHEAWHVERKRAKEIAFEEAAQKMAKEMMGEQK